MKEFDYLSYHTEFSCSGDINLKMKTRVCFAEAFRQLGGKKISVVYTIKVYKEDTLRKSNGSNMCYFTRKQIKNHLDQLKDLFPIKSSVTDSKDEEKPHFIVKLELTDLPGMYHKYALTWLRYLYEYPYNVVALDAYRLKKSPEFRFESIANLFNLIASCCCVWVGGGHSVVDNDPVGFLRRKELLAHLGRVQILNSLYPELRKKRTTIPEEIEKFKPRDIEYWSDKFFEEQRKPVYLGAYKRFKKK